MSLLRTGKFPNPKSDLSSQNCTLPKAGYTLIVSRVLIRSCPISWTISWDCEPITIHLSQYHRFHSSLILRETWRETFPVSSLAGYTLIISRVLTCSYTISWTISWDCEPVTIHFSQYHRFCSSLILQETWWETCRIVFFDILWKYRSPGVKKKRTTDYVIKNFTDCGRDWLNGTNYPLWNGLLIDWMAV